MANKKITKEEVKKIVKTPGKVRGQVFLTDLEYVRDKKGKEGVERLKKKIKEWDVLIDYESARALDWYPVGFRAISALAVREAFNWGDKEMFDLGNNAPKYSFIVKLLMKYFLSLERTLKESPNYWKKHYTVGKLETAGPYGNYCTVRLKNFKIDPILRRLYEGYFLRIIQYVVKSDKMSCKETKCMFSGDIHHEFHIEWE